MLHAQDISCFRGSREFFFNLSFSVQPGDAWIILGQNGAGKSTLLSALVQLIPLTGGHVFWKGQPLHSQIHDFHKSAILIGHKLALKGRESPAEYLERWASYQKCSKDSIPEILKTWGIEDPHRQVRTYSAGQQKRIALSRLLLEPKTLWLLDEPTSQLDTKGQEILNQLVEEHRKNGGAVVACTHTPLNWPNCHYLDLDTQIPQTNVA